MGLAGWGGQVQQGSRGLIEEDHLIVRQHENQRVCGVRDIRDLLELSEQREIDDIPRDMEMVDRDHLLIGG